jgi:RNA polymerase sigma factor (sigma-70 family)
MGMEIPPFQSFLGAHAHDVLRFLVALVGRDEADDCFQETFLSALRAYPRLRDGANLRGWILTIAHRKAMDAHRGRGRRPRAEENIEGPVAAPSGSHQELWEELRGLSTRQRTAVVLRYVNELSYREIGALLGCTEEAARQNVHDSMKKLRKTWPR